MYFSLFVFGVILNILVGAYDDYIINTGECKMPSFPAFSEETNLIYNAQNYTPCSSSSDLWTFTTVKNNTAYLHINPEHEVFHNQQDKPYCVYSYVSRNGSDEEPDVGISFTPYEYFNTTIELKSNTVMVKCYQNYTVAYANVHNSITIPDPITEKMKRLTADPSRRPVSVLFVVIDSVSRLNLERTMPKTKAYLLENKFTEFVGYNKIDDNTFPNFIAFLTGLNLRQSNLKCNPYRIGGLDSCQMIWYDFRDLGYATAYAEDWTGISTFNYLKMGFKNPPADFYLKPYMEAAEYLGIRDQDTMPYCSGPETQGERILNLAKDFAVTFKNKPSFGVFWMNTFSHNYINSPSGMDEKIKDFFEDLKRNGIFDDSVVILLSDHGIRFGEIRQTIQGWYEERLPVNFIALPPWFINKFPKKYEHFKNNANKLTSNYDLYMTLQDILNISAQNYSVLPSMACPTCQSLFSKIPRDRSCRNAGVPEQWCTCIPKFNKADARLNDEVNRKAARLTLNVIRSKHMEPDTIWVNNILFSGISYISGRKSYLLIVIETNIGYIYQGFFRIRGDPVNFVRTIQVLQIY